MACEQVRKEQGLFQTDGGLESLPYGIEIHGLSHVSLAIGPCYLGPGWVWQEALFPKDCSICASAALELQSSDSGHVSSGSVGQSNAFWWETIGSMAHSNTF